MINAKQSNYNKSLEENKNPHRNLNELQKAQTTQIAQKAAQIAKATNKITIISPLTKQSTPMTKADIEAEISVRQKQNQNQKYF